jgi:hypothetical protein
MTDQSDQWKRELKEQERARFRLLLKMRVRLQRARFTRNWAASIFLLGTAVTLASNWQWADIQVFTPFGAIGVLTATGLATGASQMIVNGTHARIELIEEAEH